MRLFLFIPVIFTLVLTSCMTDAVGKEFYENIKKGDKKMVWARMCQSLYCYQNVCMKFEGRDKIPARAIITIDATYMSSHEKEPVTSTGEYCSPRKNMTYFMTYSVYVEAPDQDISVTFYESDDYK